MRNGWQHYETFGKVQISKSFDNVVYFRGTCRSGRVSKGTTIATLPQGFRPERDRYKVALNSNYENAILKIEQNGNVTIEKNVEETWLNLDNISFKI